MRSRDSKKNQGKAVKSNVEQTYYGRGDVRIEVSDDPLFWQLLEDKVDFPFIRPQPIEVQRILIAWLSLTKYGIDEQRTPFERTQDNANIQLQTRYQMFDGEAFFKPLKNKFQTMHVTLKNKQHQELRDCIVKVIAEGVDIVQSFQLLSKYTLIPHQELQLQPFVIKTSEAPL